MKLNTTFFATLTLIALAVPSFAQQKTNPTVESEIKALVKQMTLAEKVGMIHANSSFTSAGVSRLGIPELVMSDGPHGVDQNMVEIGY